MSRLASVLFLSALAAGCSTTDHATSEPTPAQYDDTAQQLGNAISTPGGGGEAGSMADLVVLANGGTLPGFTASACGQFTGAHVGLRYAYTLTCEDGSGNTLAACGDATDRADATIDWSGHLALPGLDASVDRSGEVHLTGAKSATATFDGSGSFTLEAAVTSLTRQVTTDYKLSADAIYDGVLIDTASRRIVGGEIAYDVLSTVMTTDAITDNQFEVHAQATFAADGSATLVLDGTHTYPVDMSSGVIVSVK